MQVVDSHVHFWNPELLHYAWLDGKDTLNRIFLPSDYLAESADVEVTNIVFVEADCANHQGLDEVRWVENLDERIQAIVAFASLEQGDASRSVLETLKGHSCVKGVRRLLQSEPSGFSIQPGFIQGVQSLADYDFSFDICVFHHQLEDVLTFVRQCPNVRFVLNHAGKPDIKTGTLDPWRDYIQQLAEFDNVMCKLSGLTTLAGQDSWSIDDLKPYVDHLLNTFGTGRLMFGSDYPVLTLAGTHSEWISVVQELLLDISDDEKSAIYAENAKSFYKINKP